MTKRAGADIVQPLQRGRIRTGGRDAMSCLTPTLVSPAPAETQEWPELSNSSDGHDGLPLDARAVLELAHADDLESGMAAVVAILGDVAGVARVEWWAPDEDGATRLVAAAGRGRGRHQTFPLGPAGSVVVVGRDLDPRIAASLDAVLPIARRRWADERLLQATMELARRNEALEDYASLVAHELKNPLQAALVAGDPSHSIEQALDLVDSLLQA